MEEPEVIELVNYCKELEDSVVENAQVVDQTIILKQLISEINKSCYDLLQEDEKSQRWSKDFESVDFKEAIVNLKNYINEYCLINKIRL